MGDELKTSDIFFEDGTKFEGIKTLEASVDYSNGEDYTAVAIAAFSEITAKIKIIACAVGKAIENFKTFYDAVLFCYPNKRVVWLAKHHHSERVRKKNIRRIKKWIERRCAE